MCFSASSSSADETTLNQAKQLLDGGKAADAYNLLQPLENSQAGDPRFDYLLGISAADSGHYNQAVFALERVLAVEPGNLQARAEIARAYLALGETETSENEFRAVKSQTPPEDVQKTIDHYLDVISRGKAGQKTSISGFAELSLGYDTNANSASNASSIAIPAFGGTVFTRGAGSTGQKDTFASYTFGASIVHPLSPDQTLTASVSAGERLLERHDNFATQNMDGEIGYALLKGDDRYSVTAQAQTMNLNNDHYRDVWGSTLQWQRMRGDSAQLSAYLQYSNISYPTAGLRDADRVVLGGAYVQALGGNLQPIVFGGLYVAQEEAKSREFGHDGIGFRFGGQLTLSPTVNLFATGSYEKRNYRGQDSLFLVRRDDDQYDLSIGAGISLGKGLKLTPYVSYTNNASNIPLYKFERIQSALSLRYDF